MMECDRVRVLPLDLLRDLDGIFAGGEGNELINWLRKVKLDNWKRPCYDSCRILTL